jgi:hypothetical protein
MVRHGLAEHNNVFVCGTLPVGRVSVAAAVGSDGLQYSDGHECVFVCARVCAYACCLYVRWVGLSVG